MRHVNHLSAVVALALLGNSGLAGAQPTSTPLAPVTQPRPCESVNHRGLDFWVGDWVVYRADTNQRVARSRIDSLHDGCVIREQWMPTGSSGGSSLSHYDSSARVWRQLWLDNTGGRVEFTGGLVGSDMVLTGQWPNVNGPGSDAIIRMTYTRQADGSVVQRGDASTDQGRTWQLNFLFIYRHETTPEPTP